MTTVVLLTVFAIGVIMLMMSVGVILSGRCLRGWCGGPEILGPDGESLLCATCPKRKDREHAESSELVALGDGHNPS